MATRINFYMDDVFLETIQEPPLVISTPLDEYYVGETIPWTPNSTTTNGTLALTLLSGQRLIVEQTVSATTRTLHGTFDTSGLQSGIYTLQARISTPPQHAEQTARRQVVVAPNPFGW